MPVPPVLEAQFFFTADFMFHLSLAELGLCCCARAFSSGGERRLLFVVRRVCLPAVTSLILEHRLQGTRAALDAVPPGLDRCSSHALELRLSHWGVWA